MSTAAPKPKFPAADALVVAKILCDALKPVTEKLIVAGSLRRRKPLVGDVEILYIPKLVRVQDGLFAEDTRETNETDRVLRQLLQDGVIYKRQNTLGSEVWGDKNKLARHRPSDIPVDLFAATPSNWFNYLVCRTGGAENNVEICNAAIRKGWKWNPYGEGFTDEHGGIVRVTCEEDVFRLAGLPFKEPKDRS